MRMMLQWRVALLLTGVAGAQIAPVAGAGVCKTIEPDAMDGPIASPENHTVLYEDRDVRPVETSRAK
jgi:hypothetical protein